ncbi:hypothetical protein [Clostridium beijerinckii]|uniref:hypothetical protein n=1 Tax=Clostridium beijerinckii TaxID=1520 RepID=UPI0022E6C166|nr:hypothetical protein [Clostridium beijerinckii]
MSVNLTDQEAMILSQFFYSIINNDDIFKRNFKGKGILQEIAERIFKNRGDRNIRGALLWEF